jgi:hypothetical protein
MNRMCGTFADTIVVDTTQIQKSKVDSAGFRRLPFHLKKPEKPAGALRIKAKMKWCCNCEYWVWATALCTLGNKKTDREWWCDKHAGMTSIVLAPNLQFLH